MRSAAPTWRAIVVVAVLWASALPSAAHAVEASAAHDFITAAHELFVLRPPDDDELARWEPTIEVGDLRALTYVLASSDEWAGRRIDDLYDQVLGREAEDAGRRYWLTLVADGHTIESIGAFLYGSAEYFRRAGGSDPEFVDALYEDLLGRPAEPDGHEYWLGQLDDGTPRTTVSAAFFDSIESRRARVELVFEAVLGRRPPADGRAHWMDEMRSIGELAVAAELAATTEFWKSATGTVPPTPPERGYGTGFERYATADDVHLSYPATLVEIVGYHQSGEDGALPQDAAPGRIPWVTMSSRGRGTHPRGAGDVVVAPDTEIRSPVTGTVVDARTYVLYCDYSDDLVVIEPDDHPGWYVRMLHIDGVQVEEGDRVIAGHTVLAPRATVLPFDSQVDDHAGSPPWPHVHVEVVDPSVPDRPSNIIC